MEEPVFLRALLWSVLIADIFDERNEAVTRMIAQVISVAKKRKRKIELFLRFNFKLYY
jgi:hypothetical protein